MTAKMGGDEGGMAKCKNEDNGNLWAAGIREAKWGAKRNEKGVKKEWGRAQQRGNATTTGKKACPVANGEEEWQKRSDESQSIWLDNLRRGSRGAAGGSLLRSMKSG
jgi:hypothetical protein